MFEYKTIIRGNANNVNPDTQFEVRAIVKAKSGGEAINHLMEWNMEEGGEPCYMARAYIWQKNKFNGTAIAKWDRINKPIETILERKLIDHADIKEMRCEG